MRPTALRCEYDSFALVSGKMNVHLLTPIMYCLARNQSETSCKNREEISIEDAWATSGIPSRPGAECLTRREYKAKVSIKVVEKVAACDFIDQVLGSGSCQGSGRPGDEGDDLHHWLKSLTHLASPQSHSMSSHLLRGSRLWTRRLRWALPWVATLSGIIGGGATLGSQKGQANTVWRVATSFRP